MTKDNREKRPKVGSGAQDVSPAMSRIWTIAIPLCLFVYLAAYAPTPSDRSFDLEPVMGLLVLTVCLSAVLVIRGTEMERQ